MLTYTWNTEDKEDVRKHTVHSHAHCGGNHPHAKFGEILEDSEFMKDYLIREKARVEAIKGSQ
jgi:hypothetical protein